MKNFSFLLILLFISMDCKKGPVHYNVKAKVNRIGVFKKDKYNNPLLIDLEIVYHTCPGNQLEVLRAGKKIANCIKDYKAGDKIDLEILWHWDSMGYYKWDVINIAGCDREIDPNDEGTFNLIEECEDMNVYGVTVGFKCDRIPNDVLIEKCPWFQRE